MTKLVLYIDGSGVQGAAPGSGKRQYVNGWSIIACENGDTTECSGAINIRDIENGTHEFFAFVEGIKYAQRKGYGFQDISIYTDDEVVSHIGHSLHKDNFSRRFIMHLDRWKYLCKRYYDDQTYEDVLKCVIETRIHKVKGHDRCVYNIRADYLAKHAAQVKLFGAAHREPLMTLEQQLEEGIVEYGKGGKISRWYPPFVKTVSDVLGMEPGEVPVDMKSLVAQQVELNESLGLS